VRDPRDERQVRVQLTDGGGARRRGRAHSALHPRSVRPEPRGPRPPATPDHRAAQSSGALRRLQGGGLSSGLHA
jgi:hypothetical protein